MPWCPNCKTEYREGFTVCADCGSELVDEEPENFSVEEGPEDDLREPERYQEAAGRDAEPAVESADLEGMGGESERRTGLYQDSSERASDNRSSAWILLGLGILGLVVVVLGVTKILPLHLGNPYLLYGVMGAIFILFVVAGVVSMKNARIFEKKAESENSLRQTLLDWCRENLNASDIDTAVRAGEASEEIAYFRRSSYIKERLNHQFVNLNQGFLDRFIDDYVYEEIFEEKTE